MLCPRCSRSMKNVMHFENGKSYQYNECRKCNMRTKNKRIHFENDKNSKKA